MDEVKEYGHKKMIIWKNIDRVDQLVHHKILPKIPYSKNWLRRQIESSLDSVGANFVEGYYSGSISEYLRFLRYSRRSLAELRDHISRTLRKRFLEQAAFEYFDKLVCQTLYLFNRLISSLEAKI